VHHLACAAWHCFTLMEFVFNKLGTDDIPERIRAREQEVN
jgi:hypothetical protein